MRAVYLLLIAGSLTLSGCLIGPPDDHAELEWTDTSTVVRSATDTHEQSVGLQLHATAADAVDGWTLTMPAQTLSMDVTLSWANGLNTFSLRIEPPEGEPEDHTGDGQEVAVGVTPAQSGTYRFVPRASGVVLEDTVTLTVSYTWAEYVTRSGGSTLSSVDRVVVERDGDDWVAKLVHERVGHVGEAVDLEVRTFNGPIDLSGSGESTRVSVTAHARADSEARARELVESVRVDIVLLDASVRAVAERGLEPADSESLGASIDLVIPAVIGGKLKTSNGPVELQDVESAGLDVDTSNGPIRGRLSSSGDVTLSTSNGPVEVKLTPSASLRLVVDTSNGAVQLGLKEADAIGYRLAASTSNGRVSEDMSEASLSGEDDRSGTLETSGYGARTIQVSGSVESSNGPIHFDGW